MSFLYRYSVKEPLTEDRIQKILKTAHCTVRYRFALVLAVYRTEVIPHDRFTQRLTEQPLGDSHLAELC